MFVDSNSSVSHDIMKGEEVSETQYEISISKADIQTQGESVLSSVAENTSLIMSGGTDYTNPDSDATIQITLNSGKRREVDDLLPEPEHKKVKY